MLSHRGMSSHAKITREKNCHKNDFQIEYGIKTTQGCANYDLEHQLINSFKYGGLVA